jgi:hypothetical protein
MCPTPILENILAKKVVYHHDTGLFPFSPRQAIDQQLIDHLKHSIGETGLWQPIVVRSETMEGIAGNHRFLAYLGLARDQGRDLDRLEIPAVLIDCDEGLAVSIALIENELREDLTQREMLRTLLKAAERKPQVVETIFKVDSHTIEQLRFWEDAQDYHAKVEAQRQTLQRRLTRGWLTLINERLSEYPEIRAAFLKQLRHPSWVQARTLDALDHDITRALLRHGVRFEAGKTWNGEPPSPCLGGQMTFKEVKNALRRRDDPLVLGPDGSAPHFCQYLRLSRQYVRHFVPCADGDAVLEVTRGEDINFYPPEALERDKQCVQGDSVPLVSKIEAFCVAPDVHESYSCFHQLEAETIKARLQVLTERGLPTVLPSFVQERKGMGEFVWRHPERQGVPCTPENCIHATDDLPGFVALLQPGDGWQMLCIHAECGEAAQEALVDQEKRARQEKKRRRQAALDTLRQASVTRTLLAPADKRLDLAAPLLLEAIESVLVPAWDALTMLHVVAGWQAGERARIAAELGDVSPTSRQVTRAFRERHGELVQKATQDNVREMFQALRQKIVQSAQDLPRWVSCLAVIHLWRDDIETIEQIEQANREIASSV